MDLTLIKDGVFLFGLIAGLLGQYFHMKNKISLLEQEHKNDHAGQDKEISRLDKELKEVSREVREKHDLMNDKLEQKMDLFHGKMQAEFKSIQGDLRSILVLIEGLKK